jgi:hypothetical protein
MNKLMTEVFDAKEFLAKLDLGLYDGRLDQELRKLSDQQLEYLSLLAAQCEVAENC